VSAVPAEIAGIGSTQLKLRQSPSFDPLKAGVDPQEYFVLSRIDGLQTLRDVLLATGLPVERAISIVQRLRAIGALLIHGETTAPVVDPSAAPRRAVSDASGSGPQRSPTTGRIPVVGAPPITGHGTGTSPAVRSGPAPVQPAASSAPSAPAAAASAPPSGSTRRSTPPAPSSDDPVHDLSLPGLTPTELAALREDVPLDDPIRRRILAMARLADGRDPWALLGVHERADPRHLKRAYFRLSKEIHPDRYFGQQLGSFAERLPVVFEAMSRAYARLTSPDKARAAPQPGKAEQPQTPQEYAAELFDRACQLEIGGDHLDAMKLFAAAVRVDSQPRYLRRAASCALAAGQPRSAVEYAKKAHSLAPADPSAARLLAAAFRSAGKLSDAEEVLVMAMALKSENDVLTSELRNDLVEVRRLLAQ
jgi:DnaJ domain/Tetratricopeptide repeat